MIATIISSLSYIIFGVLVLFTISIVVNLYKNKPTWGQIRRMGIPFIFFLWIQAIFWIVMAESLYSIISFIANIPVWVDIIITLIILIITVILFFKVSKNTKFNKALFIPIILLPLGFPGTSIIAKAVKAGSIEITHKLGLSFAKSIDFLKPNFTKIIKEAPNQIGVYLVRQNGKVMYVGRAIEQRAGQATSGLRKRLLEHFRGSSSGKKELFQYKDNINIEIRPLNNVNEVKKLEAELIRKHNTVNTGWNKRYED